MALAETANLIVNLGLKGNFARDMGKATKSLDAFAKGESRAFKAGAQIGTGIKNMGRLAAVGVGFLATQVGFGLQSLVDLEKQTAQTNAVIKSTGGIAGVTAEEVGRLAEKYESLNAIVSDEVIRSGENLLLTFTNINKKAFEPALQAALDMNTRLGKGPDGLAGTVKTLGIALNDPTKGLGRLSKAGVTFTEAQIKRIKTLQKEGKLYEAQAIILKELEKRYGGAFVEEGGTVGGRVAKFGDAVEDLQRTLASGLLPVVGNIADALSDLFQDPAIIQGVKDFGEDLGKFLSPQNIKAAISDIRDLAAVIAPAFRTAADAIGLVVGAFAKLPPDLRNLLIGAFAVNKLTGGLVTNVGGGLIGAVLKQLKSAVVTVHGGVVNVSGPGAGVPGVGGKGGGGVLGTLSRAILPVAIVSIGAGVAFEVSGINDPQHQGSGTSKFGSGTFRGTNDQAIQLQHINAGIAQLTGRTDANSQKQLAGLIAARNAIVGSGDRTTTTVEGMRGLLGQKLDVVKTSTIEAGVTAKNAQMQTKEQIASGTMIQAALMGSQIATTLTSAYGTQGAVRSVAPPIVGAIRSIPQPITTVTVNVTATHVTKSTTVQNRYGQGGGSGSQNARPGDSGV